MPFLEVLTRTFGGRPNLMRRCRESLEALTDSDWAQTLIRDDAQRGVAWAERNLSTVTVTGEWAWVLDDDDVCACPDLVRELKRVVAADCPDVIVVQVQNVEFGLLPRPWPGRPVLANICSETVVTRREIWNQYRDGWRDLYEGDFWFIDGLWQAGVRFAWLPVVAAAVPHISRGQCE
jgi:hypothetical protein